MTIRSDAPASIETERAVLGAILLDNAALEETRSLSPDDFFLGSHQQIFRVMGEMAQQKFPIDLVTLAEALLSREQLENIGGASYVSSLTDGLPKLSSIKHYVRIVRDKARRRKVLHDADAIASAAADENVEVRETLGEAKALSETLSRDSQFELKEDGVYAKIRSKENQVFSIKVCAPLGIAASTRSEEGDDWGRLLKWKDADNRAHTWAMPMSLLSGSGEEFRKMLLSGGLELAVSQLAKIKLSEYVQSSKPSTQAISISKLGWHGNVFVLPDQIIGESDKLYFYQSPQEGDHRMRVRGTAEDWRDCVGRYCAGNSRLLLAAGCAFAAPLVTPLAQESGGFHFYGRTSTGKSTALIVAGSIWGGGNQLWGYTETWRNTCNALEMFGEIHNDGFGCLDELAEVDPRQLSESLYMLANGQGKGRMTKTITSRRRLNWTILFLSSGELTLNEHVQATGKTVKMGVEIRLVNIPADAEHQYGLFESISPCRTAAEFAKNIREAALKVFGAPIRKFLDYFISHRSLLIPRIKNERDEWLKKNIPEDAPSEIRRAAGRFALAAVAGELATEIGLTGWPVGDCAKGIQVCLDTWLKRREPSDAEASISQVRTFLALHGASRFQVLSKNLSGEFNPEDRIINRAGYRRVDADENTHYLIFPDVFRSEVCRGFDVQSVARELKARKLLITDNGNYMKQICVPGTGSESRARFYDVSGEIFNM